MERSHGWYIRGIDREGNNKKGTKDKSWTRLEEPPGLCSARADRELKVTLSTGVCKASSLLDATATVPRSGRGGAEGSAEGARCCDVDVVGSSESVIKLMSIQWRLFGSVTPLHTHCLTRSFRFTPIHQIQIQILRKFIGNKYF